MLGLGRARSVFMIVIGGLPRVGTRVRPTTACERGRPGGLFWRVWRARACARVGTSWRPAPTSGGATDEKAWDHRGRVFPGRGGTAVGGARHTAILCHSRRVSTKSLPFYIGLSSCWGAHAEQEVIHCMKGL